MAKFRKPSKKWSELSEPYKKRMARHGLNGRNWRTAKGAELRTAARGHAKTPERPTRAAKNPARYSDYIQRRGDWQRQLAARKERLFGNRVGYRPSRAIAATIENPMWQVWEDGKNDPNHKRPTSRTPRDDYVRLFLAMGEDDVLDVDWTDDDWGFLFYH